VGVGSPDTASQLSSVLRAPIILMCEIDKETFPSQKSQMFKKTGQNLRRFLTTLLGGFLAPTLSHPPWLSIQCNLPNRII